MEQPREQPAADHVLVSPTWLFALRIAQAVLALIVLALAAAVAHDLYLDELGLALAVSLITWIVVVYALVTERVASCRAAYHVVAVLVLDAVLIVLWLATFAAVAARRATFVVDVSVSRCFDNGGAFNSKTCMFRRAILFRGGRDMMSAVSGLGALLWLSYIATFVWVLLAFLRGRKEGRFPLGAGTAASTSDYPMEHKVEQQQQQQPGAPDQYQQSPPAQGHPQPAQSPYQQQPPYSPSPEPQRAYAQYAPQQYPQHYQPALGSELSAPSPATGSPPPQQPYHYQQ